MKSKLLSDVLKRQFSNEEYESIGKSLGKTALMDMTFDQFNWMLIAYDLSNWCKTQEEINALMEKFNIEQDSFEEIVEIEA